MNSNYSKERRRQIYLKAAELMINGLCDPFCCYAIRRAADIPDPCLIGNPGRDSEIQDIFLGVNFPEFFIFKPTFEDLNNEPSFAWYFFSRESRANALLLSAELCND